MNLHWKIQLVSVVAIFYGIATTGRSQELKPAWRPKNILAEYRAVPSTYVFLAEVEVQEWNQKLNMLVDTGCSTTCFDTSFKKKLRPTERTISITLAREQNDLPVFHAPSFVSQRFRPVLREGVICLDFTELRKSVNIPVDGVIGMDCFQNSLIHFDFDRNSLILASSSSDDSPRGTRVPLKVDNACLYATLRAGTLTKLEFLIDSGMQSTMGISHETFERLVRERIVAKNGNSRTKAWGAAGIYFHEQGVCSSLPFLGYVHHDLHVVEHDENILGAYFLGRYRVTLDVPKQVGYFDPGRRHLQRDCSELDGVDLGGKLHEDKVVVRINPKRLAYLRGLREGDVIIQIGDKSARDLSHEQATCHWMDLRATVLELRIQRGDETFVATIRGDERLSVLDSEPVELVPIGPSEAKAKSKEAGAELELTPIRKR